MFYCTPKGTLTALPVIHASFLAVPHTWEKPWKNLQKPKKLWKNLQKHWKTKKKPWKNQKNNNSNISRLFGEGGSQPRLSENCFFFFWFFQGVFGFPRFLQVFPMFFGFDHFQPSASFSTLAVRCLHAFKLAGTNRLTTAALNILGLRIKTAHSNFEISSHILDNNLSFMLS